MQEKGLIQFKEDKGTYSVVGITKSHPEYVILQLKDGIGDSIVLLYRCDGLQFV
jgi:hypothetical protein